MLESLYEQASSFPYRILIETSFKSLVETCLNQSTPQNWAKNAAKVLPHPILLLIVTLALKNLLHAFPEEVQKDFTNLDESINDALGLYLKRSIVPDTSTNSFRTEAEQKFLRKKQAVLEQIEKDREGVRYHHCYRCYLLDIFYSTSYKGKFVGVDKMVRHLNMNFYPCIIKPNLLTILIISWLNLTI